MAFHYPNGQPYLNNEVPQSKKQATRPKATTLFGKRGMSLEEELNDSNQYYRSQSMAVVYKKPTPIQIVKVDYPARSQAVIKEAYFKQASTTDYNGIYQGRYLDFEAKETKNKTSFPLSNFHEHQIYHMNHCLKQKGIVFVLLFFSSNKQYFLVPAKLIIDFWKRQKLNGRKSIPLKDIKEYGYEIIPGYAPRIPYLEVLDQHFFKGDYSHDK